MAILRRWLLISFALILGGESIYAAGTREEKAYAAAVAAFQDQVWNRAETEFAQFVQKFPKSTNAAAAVLWQAQAELKQNKTADAQGLLAAHQAIAGPLADQYAFWVAQAEAQAANFEAAAENFYGLAQTFTNSPLRLRALVESASAQAQLTNWVQVNALLAAPDSIFQRVAQQSPGDEIVVRGRLLLAQSEFAQRKFSEANNILNPLAAATLAPELDWQRLYLLAQVKLGEGDLDAALAVMTNLTRLPKNGELAAASTALRGSVLEKAGRLPEAMAAWSENLVTNVPVARQSEAVLKIAELAAVQTNLATAGEALKKYLRQFGDATVATLARLRLGELYLQEYAAQPSSNYLALAQAQFDELLGATNNSSVAGKAFLNRGWCWWLATNIPESLLDFKKAAEQLPPSEDLAVAKFKIGDAMFQQTNFAGAREYYSAVLTQFDAFPAVAQSLGANALYQILRADLELRDQAGAEAALQRLLKQFPKSELVDKSLLLAGQGFSDFGAPKNARDVFQKFVKQYPDSALHPQVALAEARTYEWESDWGAAIAAYEKWRGDFPTNALRSQVEFALAQVNFRAGNETVAFIQFTNFVAQSAADPLAPTAQWWVADHFFRVGDFVNAEKNYQLLYQNWPAHELVYPARLMAGLAAVGRQGFPDAAHYFILLTADTNCPALIATKAMFAYGSVLTRMDSADTNRPYANFEIATNVFAQICAANPTNETGALAWSELGDCDVQLGAFDAATNAFAQVINSTAAGAGLRSRAQVGMGMVLEKKAALLAAPEQKPLQELALNYYRDVFYTDDATADFWMKKAGLSALPLMIAVGEGDPEKLDKFFQRLETKLPQLKATLEKKRAALKN